MLITEILARNARMYGNEIALVERDPAKNSRKEITWQEFDAEANRVAKALIDKGIKKGDKARYQGGRWQKCRKRSLAPGW